jgi:hypothetical protein
MKILILLSLVISCSHQKSAEQKPENDLVTVRTALHQAQMSYLKGCVDTFRGLKIAASFPHCVERAKAHRLEIQMIMDQEPVDPANITSP